jgi:hypothetical protein
MKDTGVLITTVAGFHFRHKQEDPSTLYRMGYYLELIYINYLTATPFQLILMYVYLTLYPHEVIVANNYLRIITRLYPLGLV